MATPSRAYMRTIRAIDRTTTIVGGIVACLIIPLVLSNTIEVIMRYFLKQPTVWASDITVMSYGALFMLGAAYALLKGAHVRTDMFWDKFSDRKKGVIDSIAFIVFFFPTMAILFYFSFDDFLYAMEIEERSTLSTWQPIIWPMRAVIPLAALLLMFQGVSELMKSLWAARTGTALVHHEKVEV
ncbi:tripartite ATP-independent periplasmic transporters, DctQ component [Variibacter gotjawalensis]|uniref:TRAP transporter small permease protein n=1 Tax=Variibacter gotjawalensis TaxID=1333996 RepID=A0A0S3PSC3_9BRAD|nr:TRAP transporter small permease subunit [Variibacter gotjawalensis]NIK49097.1 TRAP-type mannitol/chloroaromatic compound transport system permease small subunit [Variibacter gotjawalensis]RZS50953.1 TRAP-type mannitol/chloroaromatic compound transport system permease small subunit [Variibacter gotjawalensis]BAT58787.1 tripartite ATP-independent periplasmic transporters, DctQ component [Variibacter gotjawalensis]